MKLTRRAALLGTASTFALARITSARASDTIKIVVPFAAGGPTDFVARLFAEPLSAALGQQIVIENRAGASGNLGAQAVADAAADGSTLLHTTIASQALNPILFPTSRLKPLKDFVAVGTTAALPNVLVVQPKKLDVSTVAQLVEAGKRSPGGLTYGMFGHGTSPHILSLLLQKKAGFQATPVSYRGSPLALTDLVSGQIDFLFDNITTSAEQVKTGTVRGLAVTSAARSSVLPDVPTLKEAGLDGFDLNFGFSLMAPRGTPMPILTRLRDAFDAVAKSTAYVDGLRLRGADPLVVPQPELETFMQRETDRWIDVAQQISLRAPA